jgi:CRP-like cAMP-binding protein
LEQVQLQFGQVLYEADDPIDYVYFPNDALVSLLTLVDSHSALEVGMVGPEGMVGTALALGASVSPVRALVQGAGSAMRMKAAPFLSGFRQGLSLQHQVLMYTHHLMSQIAQTAACNRFHVIEERLARWLLMTRDRVGSDHFFLTQDFLGSMLGARRVGITHAAHALKQRHLIDYSRGLMEITDGHGLERAACSCYGMLKGRHGAPA